MVKDKYNITRYFYSMPRAGWKTITVSEDVYELLEALLREEKEKELVRKYRGVTHIVELAVAEYVKKYHPDVYNEFLRTRKTAQQPTQK